MCISRELEEEEEEETIEELFALAKSTDAEETRLSEKASESTRKAPGHELRHEEKGITIELSRGFASLVVASLDDARTHARIVFHRVRLQLVALARSLYTRVSSSYSSPVPPPPSSLAISRSSLFSTLTSLHQSPRAGERTWTDVARSRADGRVAAPD